MASFNSARGVENAQKKFYIFGQGISFSMSPVIHTTAFEHHGLPHTYEIMQTTTVDEVAPLIASPSFGGASVTMPHKLLISKFCDEVTDHANQIGAVNTLIVFQDPVSKERKIRGDNTDWSGLVECLKLKGKYVMPAAKTAVVIGAGGASRAAVYSLYMSGIRNIYIINRTRARAEQIAADYSSLFKITVLGSLADVGKTPNPIPDIIIGTVPASATKTEDFHALLFAKEKGICVDMAYKPRSTPLLQAAEKYAGWEIVTGVEVLLEQAFDQSQFWLGLPAPKNVMKAELEKADAKKAKESLTAGKL